MNALRTSNRTDSMRNPMRRRKSGLQYPALAGAVMAWIIVQRDNWLLESCRTRTLRKFTNTQSWQSRSVRLVTSVVFLYCSGIGFTSLLTMSQQSENIVFCLDTSGSMCELFADGVCRMDAAVALMDKFADA